MAKLLKFDEDARRALERGVNTLADASGMDLIVRLDQHLEAMAEPVAEQCGEVLKFMGDGVLAAFPISEHRSREEACVWPSRRPNESRGR